MLGEIKIIGGKFKGKKIPVFEAIGLRPTSSRVRETLFNWLMHNIRDSACLDLFAGSGALGLEALSRYASAVTFIEKNSACFKQLKKIISDFSNINYEAFCVDAAEFLTTTQKKFDIIFFDPPFNELALYKLIDIIEQRNLLNNHGLLYIESPISVRDQMIKSWTLLKEKTTKHTYYALYQRSIQ